MATSISTVKSAFDHGCQRVAAKGLAVKAQAKQGMVSIRENLRGADTVEYVLMAAIFCLGITLAAFLLRDQIAGIFNSINNNLKTVAAGGNGASITNA